MSLNWGKAIITIREKAGLKQMQLAGMAGLSQTALSLIETGKTKPTDDTLNRIAAALKTAPCFIALLAVDPESDMNVEEQEKFETILPKFYKKILSFIGYQKP